jgi:L-2-hydroxyglutarate oxidase LhgO
MKRAHWSHYDDGTYPSAEELPLPALTLGEACLWRAYLVDNLDVVDDLPEHADQLITLLDIARGYTISPVTNKLVPVPVRQVRAFVRSAMIYTTQIARLDGKAAHNTPTTCAVRVLTSPGLVLVASTDDSNVSQLSEFKQQIRTIIKKLGPSAEPRASIEGDAYTMQ